MISLHLKQHVDAVAATREGSMPPLNMSLNDILQLSRGKVNQQSLHDRIMNGRISPARSFSSEDAAKIGFFIGAFGLF
jgi:hypothetical protein